MNLKPLPLLALTLALAASPSYAQVSRVFVSVNGNDGNACLNQSTPCRTIIGGVGVTIQGGVGSITRSTFFRNSTGVRVLGGVVVISDSVVIQNTEVGLFRTGGVFASTGNNVVEGNATDAIGVVAGSLK